MNKDLNLTVTDKTNIVLNHMAHTKKCSVPQVISRALKLYLVYEDLKSQGYQMKFIHPVTGGVIDAH